MCLFHARSRANAACGLKDAVLGGGPAAAGDAVAVDAVHAKHEGTVLGALAVLRPLRRATNLASALHPERNSEAFHTFAQSAGCLSSHVLGIPSCRPLNLVVCNLHARAGSAPMTKKQLGGERGAHHLVAVHFSPLMTGHEACMLLSSSLPVSDMSQNRMASPVRGLLAGPRFAHCVKPRRQRCSAAAERICTPRTGEKLSAAFFASSSAQRDLSGKTVSPPSSTSDKNMSTVATRCVFPCGSTCSAARRQLRPQRRSARRSACTHV